MTSQTFDLAGLGWGHFFVQQLDPETDAALLPARVMAVHRNGLQVTGPGGDALVAPFTADDADAESAATVGDWLLLDPATARPCRRLARSSLFKRRAAGADGRVQLIAANVDTLFVVSSCNQDFNPARLERYLALAREAEVAPVVVLTKADLAAAPQDFARAAAKLLPGLLVETLDARDPDVVARLTPWIGRGQTAALLGSSGVGKSTLVATLTGADLTTQPARVDDDKGRHTTTARALHRMASGGWLLDTPGMRELGLADARGGIDAVFADVAALARTCRFSDCVHESEPGCGVRAAVDEGALDPDRLKRWRKLVAEEARATETIAARRDRERAFGAMVRRVQKAKNRRSDV